MATLVGDVVVVVVVLVGFVAAVVVRISMTAGRLLSVAIVIIPAMHAAKNKTHHTMIL